MLFLAVIAFALIAQLWLLGRQRRHVLAHRHRIPSPFEGFLSLKDHQKAADYTLAGARLARIELLFSTFLLLLWTLGGGLNALHDLIPSGAGMVLGVLVLTSLLELPFSLYRTFFLEQRFGFNHSTPALFFKDTLKEMGLLVLFGLPLAGAMLWLMEHGGQAWWLYAWGLWMAFALLLTWAYPRYLAPLFNTFTPLDDAPLRRRIQGLLERNGFSSQGIDVMDGSLRSSHGNAYFTGLGRQKRIVFYDTLLKDLTHEEIEAVLAHELGHFKGRHVLKGLILMAMVSLGALALFAWLSQKAWFYGALGVEHPSPPMALALFLLLLPTLNAYLQPLLASFSRRHEFEADDFAASQTSPSHLISALAKLYRENAHTLTPDPLYSAYHDSHPAAPARVANLKAKEVTHENPAPHPSPAAVPCPGPRGG